MSYKSDSEISDCAYGCTYATQSSQLNKTFTLLIQNEYDKRKKSALWFVSNCRANLRLKFALGLGRLYPVQIYGDCKNRVEFMQANKPTGNFYAYLAVKYLKKLAGIFYLSGKNKQSDDLNFLSVSDSACKRHSVCELNELNSHRYYLSFESKNCSNYITEKLWRTLRTFMIPIVMQPSKIFYELYAPKNSFIHLQDFDYDYAKLAAYLKRVDADFSLYLSYHAWRLDLNVVFSREQTEKRRFCEMCTKLNTQHDSIYYEKVSDWFNRNCVLN